MAGGRALLYLRVSTVLQAEGFSLATQREGCEALAQERGAVVTGVLEDTYTGTSLDRPSMNALRDLVARGEVDLVIAHDPDRISRNLYDLLIITSDVEKAPSPAWP